MTKMAEAPHNGPLIVVTRDALAGPVHVVQLAAMLAQLRRGSLHGLFIEDEDLLTVAGLPFSQEVLHAGGRTRDFSNQHLERSMARMAAEFRHSLAQQAETLSISWTFSSTRRSRAAMTLVQNTPADLLIISPATGQTNRENRIRRILLLEPQQPAVQKALLNVLEAGPPCPTEITALTDYPQRGSGEPQVEHLPLQQLQQTNSGLSLQTAAAADLERLLATPGQRPDLVLLPRDSDTAEIAACLRFARCPVIVAS